MAKIWGGGGHKQPKPENNNTNGGFGGDCLKPKMTLFKKVFLGMGEKVGFTSIAFGKQCFAENIIFIVFSANHSNCSKKDVEKTKMYEK